MNDHLATQVLKNVKASYVAIADEFDQTRRMPWKEFAFFLPYIRKGMRVLDAGCGNGRLYEYLQKRDIQYVGIDGSGPLIKIAKKRHPEAEFCVDELHTLKSVSGDLDAIFCIAAFHHLPSVALRRQALQSMRALLKKDGVLILTVWNLYQKKYRKPRLRAAFSFLNHFGLKYAWNDVWIPSGKEKPKRYYHAFRPGELRRLFDPAQWAIDELYFTRQGNRVGPKEAYNICVVARKL